MKDIIKKYKRHKLLTNVNIVLASLVLAFGINYTIFNDSNISKNIKTSILNSKVQEQKADISIEQIQDEIFIVANTSINNLDNLSLSFTYNPENIDIIKIDSEYGDIINMSNTPGVSSIILTTKENTNIKGGEKIIKLSILKKENKSVNINILNANFKDINNENYLLSTSGITF